MVQAIRALMSEHLFGEAGRDILGSLADNASLFQSGLLDSLGVVQLIGLLEEEFDVIFDPLDIEMKNFETLENIAAFISSKIRRPA